MIEQDVETLQAWREQWMEAVERHNELAKQLREKDEALEREAGARADLRKQLTESQEREKALHDLLMDDRDRSRARIAELEAERSELEAKNVDYIIDLTRLRRIEVAARRGSYGSEVGVEGEERYWYVFEGQDAIDLNVALTDRQEI